MILNSLLPDFYSKETLIAWYIIPAGLIWLLYPLFLLMVKCCLTPLIKNWHYNILKISRNKSKSDAARVCRAVLIIEIVVFELWCIAVGNILILFSGFFMFITLSIIYLSVEFNRRTVSLFYSNKKIIQLEAIVFIIGIILCLLNQIFIFI